MPSLSDVIHISDEDFQSGKVWIACSFGVTLIFVSFPFLQLKLDEVNSEMTSLMQAVPQWEGSKDLNNVVKSYLLDMTKRVMGELDGEGLGFNSHTLSPSGIDRPASADAASRRGLPDKDLILLTDRGNTRDRSTGSTGRPRSQPDESQGVVSVRDFLSSPSKADLRVSMSQCLLPYGH